MKGLALQNLQVHWRLSKISELYYCRVQSWFELFTNCQAKQQMQVRTYNIYLAGKKLQDMLSLFNTAQKSRHFATATVLFAQRQINKSACLYFVSSLWTKKHRVCQFFCEKFLKQSSPSLSGEATPLIIIIHFFLALTTKSREHVY